MEVGLSIFQHFIRTFQLFSIVYEPGTDHWTRQFHSKVWKLQVGDNSGPVQDPRSLNVISPQVATTSKTTDGCVALAATSYPRRSASGSIDFKLSLH